MGLGGSKVQVTPHPPSPSSSTALSSEVVEEMCREAYAAGVGDADVYHTAQREAMQRQDGAVGVGACFFSAWMAFVFGRSNGTRYAEEAAALRFDAQQTLLDKVNKDLVAVVEENKTLLSVRQEQQAIIEQQRSELLRAAQQRKMMQQSMQTLKKRNASVRKQLHVLTKSLNTIQRQMFGGMIGVGVILLAVVWGTRPQRHGRLRQRLQPPPVSLTSAPPSEMRENSAPTLVLQPEHTITVEVDEKDVPQPVGEKEEAK